MSAHLRGQTAVTRAWLAYAEKAEEDVAVAQTQFLQRYEWPSLWETSEVQTELAALAAAEQQPGGGEPLEETPKVSSQPAASTSNGLSRALDPV